MNLLRELAGTALQWSLVKSEQPYKPGNYKHLIPTMCLTVVAEPGAQPVCKHFRVDSGWSVEQMLSVLLNEHFPDHPALNAWRRSRGDVPVALDGDVYEDLGGRMHTGLRKLADTKQSVITWQSLHQLHREDNRAIWATAERVLREAFAQATPPTRRALAQQLNAAIVQVLRDRLNDGVKDDYDDIVPRKPGQQYAILMMSAGCALTDLDEWMWGWLGYVVKDVEEVASPDVPTTAGAA